MYIGPDRRHGMDRRDGEDRREEPLGGIEKSTYVGSASDPEQHAKLSYDLFHALSSKIDNFQGMCGYCDRIFIKRVHPRIPLSLPELVICAAGVGILFGLGYLEWNDVLKLRP